MRKTLYNNEQVKRAKKWARRSLVKLHYRMPTETRVKVSLMLHHYLISDDMTWREVANKFGYRSGVQARAQVLRAIS